MFQSFLCRNALFWVVCQHFVNEIYKFFTCLRDQLFDSCSFSLWKIKLPFGLILVPINYLLWWWAKNNLYSVHLVNLVFSRKKSQLT